MDSQNQKPNAVKRRGQTVGAILFGIISIVFVGISSGQVLMQGLASSLDPATISCRDGLEQLQNGLQDIRQNIRQKAGPNALDEFRQRCTKLWQSVGDLRNSCSEDPKALGHLSDLNTLRVFEESALRRDQLDLLPMQRQLAEFDNSKELTRFDKQ